MQTIGQLIAREPAAARKAAPIERQLRRYRVKLSVMIVAEVEVSAYSPHEACAIAEKNPPEKPAREFISTPVAHRVEVYQPWNNTWAKVERSEL